MKKIIRETGMIKFHLVPNTEKDKAATESRSNILLFVSIIVLLILSGIFIASYVAIEKREQGIVDEKAPDITDEQPPPIIIVDPLKDLGKSKKINLANFLRVNGLGTSSPSKKAVPDAIAKVPVAQIDTSKSLDDTLSLASDTSKHSIDSLARVSDSLMIETPSPEIPRGDYTRINHYLLYSRDGWSILLDELISQNADIQTIVSAYDCSFYIRGNSDSETKFIDLAKNVFEQDGANSLNMLWSGGVSNKYAWVMTGEFFTPDSIDKDIELKPVKVFEQGPIHTSVRKTLEKNNIKKPVIKSIGKASFSWGKRYLFQAEFSGKVGSLSKSLKEFADSEKMVAIHSIALVVSGKSKRLSQKNVDASIIFALYDPNPDPEIPDSTKTQ